MITNFYSVHRAESAIPADSCSVDHLCSAACSVFWEQPRYIHHCIDNTLLQGFGADRFQLVPVRAGASVSVGIVAADVVINFATAAIAVEIAAGFAGRPPHYVVAVLLAVAALRAAAPAVPDLVAEGPAVAALGAVALVVPDLVAEGASCGSAWRCGSCCA